MLNPTFDHANLRSTQVISQLIGDYLTVLVRYSQVCYRKCLLVVLALRRCLGTDCLKILIAFQSRYRELRAREQM